MSKKTQIEEVSIDEFMKAIRKLPSNERREQWLRWLSEYDEPGYYNRLPNMNRSAKFAYNNIANPEMLLWLIQAAGVEKGLVALAESDYNRSPDNVRTQCAAIRKRVPWDVLERALW
jgi:hypothetical protein